MSLSILGIGSVCSLGTGVENFRLGLKGERQPDVVNMAVKGPRPDMSLPVYRASVEELDRFISRRALRRIDGFAKMALLSAHLAIEDAGVEFKDRARVGIVVGSGYGPIRTTFDFMDGIIDDGDHCALPTHFANSVHNALASQMSIFLDLQGPCTTITCFNFTVANVLLTASTWINQGDVDFVIAGLGDEYCDVLGYGVAGYGVSQPQAIRPFDFETCTYLPGEGFISFLLSRNSKPGKYGTLDGIEMNLDVAQVEQKLPGRSNAVLLSSRGAASENVSFKHIPWKGIKTAAYSPLFGGMPIGAAFDIGAAFVCLEDGVVYPSPSSERRGERGMEIIDLSFPLSEPSSLICLECSGKDAFNLYSLGKNSPAVSPIAV